MPNKRDLMVSVRLSRDDLAMLKRAAARLWADAPLSNSAILLTLAKQRAAEVLRERP